MSSDGNAVGNGRGVGANNGSDSMIDNTMSDSSILQTDEPAHVLAYPVHEPTNPSQQSLDPAQQSSYPEPPLSQLHLYSGSTTVSFPSHNQGASPSVNISQHVSASDGSPHTSASDFSPPQKAAHHAPARQMSCGTPTHKHIRLRRFRYTRRVQAAQR